MNTDISSPGHRHPLTIPVLLGGCFAAGAAMSLGSGLVSFLGGLLALFPVLAILLALKRARRG